MSNSNLMNHVLLNKLDDELNKAINEVGGDTSSAKGPWDYPSIIKEQLEAKGMSAELKAGPGIIIRDFHGQKFICSTSGALTTGALNPPAGSYKQSVSEVIEAGTPVQEVFEALFYKILPKLSSLYKGDIIRSDEDGSDRYNEEDIRTGLIPNSAYLRLYVANRQEPIYVLLSGHGIMNDEGGAGNIPSQPGGSQVQYTGGVSEYISVSVNNNVITATLNENGVALFNKISLIESELANIRQIVNNLDDNKSDIKELNTKIHNIETEIATLNVLLEGKASVAELNVIKSTLNNVTSQVSSFETQLNAKASVSDLSKISVKVDAIEQSNDSLNSSMNQLSKKVDTKADTVAVDNLAAHVDTVSAELVKNSSAVEEVQQQVTEYTGVIKEIQQTAVTQEQVNQVVEQEVTNTINNTQVVDGKVEEKILDALNSDEANDIKTAFNNLVSETITSAATDDTTGVVDDLFAGV